jgi:hypothetical protein
MAFSSRIRLKIKKFQTTLEVSETHTNVTVPYVDVQIVLSFARSTAEIAQEIRFLRVFSRVLGEFGGISGFESAMRTLQF